MLTSHTEIASLQKAVIQLHTSYFNYYVHL